MKIHQIAAICHAANSRYRLAIGEYPHAIWELEPESRRQHVLNGVKYALFDPVAGAADLHANWTKDLEKNGWTYGPVEKVAEKQHPCLVPYHELPEKQQVKDCMFVAIVRALEPLLEAE